MDYIYEVVTYDKNLNALVEDHLNMLYQLENSAVYDVYIGGTLEKQ